MRGVLAAALLVASGCIELRAFECSENACDLDGRTGVCEPEGFCSYPDEACASGRRFEARAPGALGGACVDGAGGSASTDASSSGGGSMTTATVGTSVGDTTSQGSSSTAPACDGDGCGWTAVEAGALHTCALDGNGAVWCWGVGAQGELGTGSNATFRDCPEAPAGDLIGQTTLGVGGHSCSLGPDGVHCWGPNMLGQVDWRTGQNVHDTPHAVDLERYTPTTVGAGENDTCVGAGNLVLCWGSGQPIEMSPNAPAPAREVAVGDDHVCALLDDDSVWCLGDDSFGQLGSGSADNTGGPVQLSFGGEAALRLSAGARHSCAITEGNGPGARDVKCWGDNRKNQAGGVVENQINAPQDVSGDLVAGAWVEVAAAAEHTCAINEAGEVWCWGDNTFGQVDPAVAEPGQLLTSAKIDLDPPIDAVDISASTTITCAIDRDGLWWCWGCLEPWMVQTSGECTVSPPTRITPCGR
ncbi:MAG: hypothetical protein AAGA54_11330 [Myxococcota bacterium]